MDGSVRFISDDDDEDDNPEPVQSPRTTRSSINAATNNLTPGPVPPRPSLSTDRSPVVNSSKKRKRAIISPSPKKSADLPTAVAILPEEEDDGATCPICLDLWDMSGEHRLTSLKCGHLFGASCIRRWLNECPTGAKSCPTCKTKATARDFRYLFAKKLCAVDNTELETLKSRYDDKCSELVKLTSEKNMVDYELQHHRKRLVQLQVDYDYLRKRLLDSSSTSEATGPQKQMDVDLARLTRVKNVRLFLEKNIEISKEMAGCRYMTNSRSDNLLFVSHKSPKGLFVGFGIRYLDLETLKTTNFIHVSSKPISDLIVTDYPDNRPNFLLAATMETTGRLFDVRSKLPLQSFRPEISGGIEEPLVSCCFGDNETLFFGGQRGAVYQFDKRNAQQQTMTVKLPTDSSLVRNVAYVPQSPELPNGALLVCTLKELSFYPFLNGSQTEIGMRGTINVAGPFSAMSYDAATGFVLITKRSNPFQYIMARFVKGANAVHASLVVKQTFLGSAVMPIQSRPVQYPVYGGESVVLSAYLQSTKSLTTWAVENSQKLQQMPVTDPIVDMCPVYLSGVRHLAALTDNKCRIFKVHEDRL